jgi:hypothetical protein
MTMISLRNVVSSFSRCHCPGVAAPASTRPGTADFGDRLRKSDQSDQARGKPIGAAPSPWFARRSVVGAVIVLLALPVAGWVEWDYAGGPGCPHLPFLGQVVGLPLIGPGSSGDYFGTPEFGF